MRRRTRTTEIAQSKPDDAASGNVSAPVNVGDESSGASASDLGSGTVILDPDSTGGASGNASASDSDGAAGPVKRGRGRPPGSGNKAKAIPGNVVGIEKLLIGTHTALAFLAQSPEFMLDTQSTDFDGKSEAKYLAQSVKDVADHYTAAVFDQKTLDWLNLFQALGIVYGTRLFAIRSRKSAERANRPVGPMPVRPAHPIPGSSPGTGFAPNTNRVNGADIAQEAAAREAARMGVVPGMGEIEFPPDHPLAPKVRH